MSHLEHPIQLSEEQIQLNFIRAGEASLREYETTGLHITHEEYTAWRESLNTANPLPIPQCHT